MPLSLNDAQTVVELARVHPEKIGVPMNIAVVDGGGRLLAFARMDRSILGSIDIALKKRDIRANFAPLLKGQLDPQEMIDKMVEVIDAEEGLYRNVWPRAVETLIKQIQERTWTLRTKGDSEVEMQRGDIA
jgi:Haem-degrading